MKLNNKGFAISSIMYIILVLAVVLIALTLAVLSSRKLVLDKLKNEVTNAIYEIYPTTYRQTLNILKEEAIAYANENSIEKDSVKISDFETSIDENTISGYKLSDRYLTMSQNNDTYDIYLGEEETIKNTTELPEKTIDIVDYKIYGNSYQETSTQGKNLFDKNGDFSDTKNYYSGNGYYGHKIQLKPNTSYVASVSENTREEFINLTTNNWYQQEGATTYWISHKTNEAASLLEGESLTFTTGDNGLIWINVTNGGTAEAYSSVINGCLSNFQIEEGTTATTYEEFIPNKPSPDYPSEVESVGDETSNLLNLLRDTIEISGNPTAAVNLDTTKTYLSYAGSGYFFSGRISNFETTKSEIKFSSTHAWYGVGFPIKCEPNKQYAFSWDTDSQNIRANISYYSEGLFLKYDTIQNTIKTTKVTTPSNCDMVVISIVPVFANEIISAKNIQWEESIVATQYEPYGMHKIPIKVGGKNLFDYTKIPNGSNKIEIIDNGLRLSGYASVTSITPEMFLEMTGLKEGDKITTSLNKKVISGKVNIMFGTIMFYTSDMSTGFYLTGSGYQDSEVTVTTTKIPENFNSENYKPMYIYGGFNSDDGSVGVFELSNIQIERGSSKTDYEPYVELKTTNIYLDEPLRKIGDYHDYIDLKKQNVFRKVGSIVLDSSLTYTFYNYNTELDNTYHFYINNNPEPQIISGTGILSNRFLGGNIPMNKTKTDSFLTSYYFHRIYAQFKKTLIDNYEGATNTDKLIQFFNENHTEVYYVFANEPDPQTIELSKILVAEGATNISIDTKIKPSNYEFTVVKKLKQL